jgi:hypothetical protein
MSQDKFIKLTDEFVYAEFAWWNQSRRETLIRISQIKEVAKYNPRQTERKCPSGDATMLWLVGEEDEYPHLLEIPFHVVIRTLLRPPTGIDNPTDTTEGGAA